MPNMLLRTIIYVLCIIHLCFIVADTAVPICGTRLNVPRIIGGSVAEEGEFPWVARLEIAHRDADLGIATCGATLIDDRWLLTAAHCFKNDILVIRATLGRSNFADPSAGAHQQQFVTNEFFIHPNFSSTTYNFDFALIKLPQKINSSNPRFVQPLCLDREQCNYPSDSSVIDGCSGGQAVGWGYTESGPMASKILQKINLPLVSLEECQVSDAFMAVDLGNEQICAGGQANADSCEGDSGGPLICIGPNKNSTTLLGVISYGSGCGAEGVPGIYARVCSAMDWLDNVRNVEGQREISGLLPVWNPNLARIPLRCKVPLITNMVMEHENGTELDITQTLWVGLREKVRFRCAESYSMIGDENSLYEDELFACGSDLEWNPPLDLKLLSCESTPYCNEAMLPKVTNGRVSYDDEEPTAKVEVGERRFITCSDGRSFAISCQEDGNWEQPPFNACPLTTFREPTTTPIPPANQLNFWLTVRNGDLDGSQKLIQSDPTIDVNWRNPALNCLGFGICVQNESSLIGLLDNCKNLTQTNETANRTIELVELLLEHDSALEQPSALVQALSSCPANQIAKYLLDKGADVDAEEGSPLAVATSTGNLEMIEILIEYGADVNANQPLLITAVRNREFEALKLLIKHGADINAANGYHKTALAYAEHYGYQEFIEYLTPLGAREYDDTYYPEFDDIW